MLGKQKDVKYFLEYINGLKHGEFISLITAVALTIENMNKTLMKTKDKTNKYKTKDKKHIGGYS